MGGEAMITDEQLAALDQAERAATRAPWGLTPMGLPGDEPTVLNIWDDKDDTVCVSPQPYCNAHFIALSRNSMRDLLDLVQYQRKLIREQAQKCIIFRRERDEAKEKLKTDLRDLLMFEAGQADGKVDNAKLRAELVAARGELFDVLKHNPIAGEYSHQGIMLDHKDADSIRDAIKRIDDTLGDG